jgi:hypothetical protein
MVTYIRLETFLKARIGDSSTGREIQTSFMQSQDYRQDQWAYNSGFSRDLSPAARAVRIFPSLLKPGCLLRIGVACLHASWPCTTDGTAL